MHILVNLKFKVNHEDHSRNLWNIIWGEVYLEKNGIPLSKIQTQPGLILGVELNQGKFTNDGTLAIQIFHLKLNIVLK